MTVRKRRVQGSRVVVEHDQEMVAGEDSTRSGAALRPVEQGSVKVAAAACNLKADWNLLAMDRGVPYPCPGNGALGNGGGGEQEKTGEELHEMARFFYEGTMKIFSEDRRVSGCDAPLCGPAGSGDNNRRCAAKA
jgi:hypothetical protein